MYVSTFILVFKNISELSTHKTYRHYISCYIIFYFNSFQESHIEFSHNLELWHEY